MEDNAENPQAEDSNANTNSKSEEAIREGMSVDLKGSLSKEDVPEIEESDNTSNLDSKKKDDIAEAKDPESSSSDSDASSDMSEDESEDSKCECAESNDLHAAESGVSGQKNVGNSPENSAKNLNVNSAADMTNVPIIMTPSPDYQNNLETINDANQDGGDQLTDLNSSQSLSFKSTSPPEETYITRPRGDSTISFGSSEFGDIRDSYASTFSDRFSVARSDWSGSSMRSSASSYNGSDHELDPDELRTPHRGRPTICRKDEPEVSQSLITIHP